MLFFPTRVMLKYLDLCLTDVHISEYRTADGKRSITSIYTTRFVWIIYKFNIELV